jgi:hypothetical protein
MPGLGPLVWKEMLPTVVNPKVKFIDKYVMKWTIFCQRKPQIHSPLYRHSYQLGDNKSLDNKKTICDRHVVNILKNMVTDVQLAVVCNMLGMGLFFIIVLYHYIGANNRHE